MRRLRPLPPMTREDITALRREYRKLKDARQDTTAIHRVLKFAVARKIRREIRAEQQA